MDKNTFNNKGLSGNSLYPWICWLLAASLYTIQSGLLILPSVLPIQLRTTYTVSSVDISLFVSLYLVPYVVMQVPVGAFLDKFRVQYVLTAAGLLIAIGCFITALSNNFTIGLFGRVVTGFGGSFTFIGAVYLGKEWFVPRKFPFIVGLTEAMSSFGVVVLAAIFALAVNHQRWQTILFEVGGLTLALSFITFFRVRDKERPEVKRSTSVKQNFLRVIKNKYIWMLGLYVGFSYCHFVVLVNMWGIFILKSFYHISTIEAVLANDLEIVGFIIGCVLIGILREYFSALRLLLLFAVLEFLFLAFNIFWEGGIFVNNILLFVLGVVSANIILPFDIAKRVVPASMYGVASGFINTFFGLTGLIFVPVVGYLLQVTKGNVYTSPIPLLAASFVAVIIAFSLYRQLRPIFKVQA